MENDELLEKKKKSMSLEQKTKEYLQKVKELGRNIEVKDELYFSDGANMKKWYNENIARIRRTVRENHKTKFSIMHSSYFAEIDNYLYDLGCLEKEKLSFDQKVTEYKAKIIELQRRINGNERILFSDGMRMDAWYFNSLVWLKSLSLDEEINKKQMAKIQGLAEIDNLIYDLGGKSVGKKTLSMEEKTQEYIAEIEKLGRNIDPKEEIYFSDGYHMKNWYNWTLRTIRKDLKESENIKEDTIYWAYCLARIDNALYDLGKQRLPFEQKFKEYMEKVIELKRNISSKDLVYFSDGAQMGSWYWYAMQWVRSIRDKNLSQEEQYKIICLAELDNILYDLGYKKVLKKKLSYEEKVKEYLEQVEKIGKNVTERDRIYFSDGYLMSTWHYRINSKIYQMRSQKEFTKEELEKLMLFAQIDDRLYDVKKNQEKTKKYS